MASLSETIKAMGAGADAGLAAERRAARARKKKEKSSSEKVKEVRRKPTFDDSDVEPIEVETYLAKMPGLRRSARIRLNREKARKDEKRAKELAKKLDKEEGQEESDDSEEKEGRRKWGLMEDAQPMGKEKVSPEGFYLSGPLGINSWNRTSESRGPLVTGLELRESSLHPYDTSDVEPEPEEYMVPRTVPPDLVERIHGAIQRKTLTIEKIDNLCDVHWMENEERAKDKFDTVSECGKYLDEMAYSEVMMFWSALSPTLSYTHRNGQSASLT